jgi:hypothetical protein
MSLITTGVQKVSQWLSRKGDRSTPGSLEVTGRQQPAVLEDSDQSLQRRWNLPTILTQDLIDVLS